MREEWSACRIMEIYSGGLKGNGNDSQQKTLKFRMRIYERQKVVI